MATETIIIDRFAFDGSYVAINGQLYSIPFDVPFSASDMVKEVLTNAGVPYRLATAIDQGNGIATGKIIIPIKYKGDVLIGINASLTTLTKGVGFVPDAATLEVLQRSHIPYENELTNFPQRLVPGDANTMYILALNARFTVFCHRFVRNVGAAADSLNIGVNYQPWRYAGTVEMPNMATDPTAAFSGSPPAGCFVYSNDNGAYNYAFRISNKFMGSYHGGETLVGSYSIKCDGVEVDPTVLTTGSQFVLKYSSTITDGTATVTITDFTITIRNDGGVSQSFPAGGISSASTFQNCWVGMAIASSLNWNEAGVSLMDGAEFMIPTHPEIINRTYLSPTASIHATKVRFRNTTNGRSMRIQSTGVTAGNFRRTYIIQDTSTPRAKLYFERLNTVALGSLTAMQFDFYFDLAAAGATTFTNLLTNPGFTASLTPWLTTGVAPVWNAASGGVMRATRDAAQDNRGFQGFSCAVGNVILVGADTSTSAGNLPSVGLTNNVNGSTSTPTPALAPVQASEALISRISSLAIATATTQYMMCVMGPGTAGQTTDFDNAEAIIVAAAA